MSKAGDIDASRITVSLTGSGSDETVAHELGRAPLEVFIVSRNANANVWRGTTAWNSTNVFLRVSSAVTVTLLFF